MNKSQIIFASHQNHGCIGTKPLDLRIPHFPTIFQRAGSTDIETHQDNIGTTVGKTPVLVVITKSIPKPQGHIDSVHNRPGIFQNLLNNKAINKGGPTAQKIMLSWRQIQDFLRIKGLLFACHLDIENYYLGHKTYFFVDTVLVDGPHRRYMWIEQLRQRTFLTTRFGANESRFPHCIVSNQNALDQFLTCTFIIHDFSLHSTFVPLEKKKGLLTL